MRRVLAGATLAVTAVWLAGAAAAAGSDDIPEEVRALHAGSALDEIRAMSTPDSAVDGSADGALTTASGTALGPLFAVHVFTEEFRHGVVTEEPVRSAPEWVTPVLAGEAALGVATLWFEPAGAAAVAGVDEQVELARGLGAAGEDAVIVTDPPSQAWFVLEDGVLTSLTPSRSAARYTLEEFAQVLAEQTAIWEANEYDPSEPLAGGGDILPAGDSAGSALPWWTWVGVGLLLLGAVSVTFSRRSRRTVGRAGSPGR